MRICHILSAGGDGEKDLDEEESQLKQNILEKEQDTARLNRFLEKAGQVECFNSLFHESQSQGVFFVQLIFYSNLILVLLNPDMSCFCKQKPTDLDLHCLSSSM